MMIAIYCRFIMSGNKLVSVWWPTTVTAKPKTSRQKQKHHGKTKNLTAKPKTSRQLKQNTSRQNQILHSKNKIALVLLWVFAFAVRYLVSCYDVFGFAVRVLVLPRCFCFCREVFGFAMTVVGHRIFLFYINAY